MISLKKRSQGFTIVELLIVIVVIGILAALVITTYAGIQGKARNTKRQTDITTLQTQVEAYYTQNNAYPAMAQLNDPTWTGSPGNNMKSLDRVALADPSNTGTSDTARQQLVAAPVANSYGYAVFAADGITACTTAAKDCAVYALTATYEGSVNNSTTFVKKNLN
ncbi:prepilin-type N-terminal cleavage/methylation domain-containing protein [Candidatus Saccharibacteria bacterium]|nr:prepilin-type N-terminal cleavage/methylation domain-containing protein [Candidatus Saccharibacteria bacterium]